MATLRKAGREFTPVIVAVHSADRENERDSSREAEQARRPETEEEMLPEQAALQTKLLEMNLLQAPQVRTARNETSKTPPNREQ